MLPVLREKLFPFLFLLSISVSVFAQTPPGTIPDFKFFKLDRSSFTNRNLAANKLIFFCFFDISCDHCQHAIDKINKQYNEFKGAAIYLITWDNQNSINLFMNRYGPGLPGKKNVTILQDLNHEFINKFRPKKYPSIFLFSRDKKLMLYDDNPDNLYKFLNQIKLAAK
ncbi:MAG: redoxin domain-containing protein [Ferruginibacter sp.]